MNDSISLLIPTHNRHRYLERALAYYSTAGFPVYIVDSTAAAFDMDGRENITYFHMPGVSLTGKIAAALEVISTPYIVMCADDDFLLHDRIADCVQFLEEHPVYASAAGNSICYKKNSIVSGKVDFAAMYTTRLTYEVTEAAPLDRIRAFFNPYRGAFYAVHRSAVLRKAFEGAAGVVKNLFLNEYLTALYPLATGAFAELPFLFHIREYADDSGDKTTPNLDAIFQDAAFKKEYEAFVAHQATLIATATEMEPAYCRVQLHGILDDFARQHQQGVYKEKPAPEKKLGKIVQQLPVVGDKLIQAYRKYRASQSLQLFVRTEDDHAALEKIAALILAYK
jgi:glycosyltransferase domain-containing protein